MKSRSSLSFRPGVEGLEERSLMAAHLTASLSAGLLRIDGTDHADRIVVRQVNNRISVDGIDINVRGQGKTASARAADVSRIQIRGLGGNDFIQVGGGTTHGRNALL